MISRIQQKLLHYVDEHYLVYISHWQDLYTQLYTLDAQKMQEIVIAWLQHSGLSVHFLTNDQSLFYSELQVGAEQTLLLYMRLTDSSSATTASYITTALVAYQAVLDACFYAPGSLPVNIKWVFDGRITQTQQDFYKATADRMEYSSLLDADRCIWYMPEQKTFLADALPLLALGTKGSLAVEFTVQTTDVPVEAQYGAIVPNAAWQLLWALDTMKDKREDILIEGFYDAVLPVEEDVIEALVHLLDHFPLLSKHWKLQEPFLGLEGLQQYCAYFLTPTCTVSYIHSGQAIKDHEAFIPQTASAQLDFQLVPKQDPVDVYTRLQNHLLNHTTVRTRLLNATRPTYTPLSDPFVKFVIQATTVTYGQPPKILPLIPPDSSSHLLQELALPTVIIPLPLVVTEPQELYTKACQESLMQHVKQEVVIIAGANIR